MPETYTVCLSKLPRNRTQLQSMPEAQLKSPIETVALTIAALNVYCDDSGACIEMLNYLRGPRPLSVFEQQFLRDRLRGKDYVPRSYFLGTSPENGYTPSEPLTVRAEENPYSRDQLSQGYLTLYLRSSGADSPRSIQLRIKPSTGQWFLWDQMLLADIRIPKSMDPWA